MAIGDDFSIDTTNKIIYNNGNSSTVYTVNAFYSWLADTFDELAYMQYEFPMKAVTDYDYEWRNGWWLDIGESVDSGDGHFSQKFLYDGSMTSLGWDADSYADGIRLLKFKASGWVDFAVADIGGQVGYVGGTPTDTGTLLGFNNTLRYAWVRVDDTGDVFSDTTTNIDIDDTTAHGQITEASITGEEQFSCIYSIGTIEGEANSNVKGQIYIFQDEEPIAEWQLADGTRLTNWDRGHINVLIQIKEMGVLIGEYDKAGFVTGFLRQGGDLYSYFDVDLNAGGRAPLPLGTETDLNQTTADYFLFYDGETGGGFTVGDIVIGGTNFAEAEIVSVVDWGTEGVLGLIGVSGTFTDNEVLNVSGTQRGDVNGTLGDRWFAYDGETNGPLTVGNDLRENASDTHRGTLVGLQDDGLTGKVCIAVDESAALADQSKYFLAISDPMTFNDTTTTTIDVNGTVYEAVAAWSDIRVQFVCLDLDYDGGTGDMNVGDIVDGATSAAQGVVVAAGAAQASGTVRLGNWNGTAFQDGENLQVNAVTKAVADGTGEFIHTTGKAFELGSTYQYDVIIDLNYYDLGSTELHTVSELYEYLKFVTRWDSAFQMKRVKRGVIDGAAYDFGTETEELTGARNATADDMTLVRTSGTITVGDLYAFGSDTEFGKLLLNITTAGDGAWENTWEYWNGAWTALTESGAAGVGEDTTDAKHFRPASAGWVEIFWDIPTDWVTTTIDGITAYWVRARISTQDAAPVARALGGQAYVYDLVAYETGEEYIRAYEGYAVKAASPLGTFAGGIFFGAQGVWIENMHADDVKSYSLIDSDGTTQDPPNKQPVEVTNLISGDKVTVMRTSAGDIDKAMYTSAAGNAQGDGDLIVTEAISNDTPSAGVVRIVDNSESDREYRIRYASWLTSTFTFLTAVAGSVTTAGDPGATQLVDSAADFGVTEDVEEGDCIYNETDGSFAHVDEVISTTELRTTRLQGGVDNEWDLSDTYSIHTLPYAIEQTNDTVYVPYLDEKSGSTSVSVTVIYVSSRAIQIDVRNKEAPIEPFTTTGTFGATGYTTACIRITDTIVT